MIKRRALCMIVCGLLFADVAKAQATSADSLSSAKKYENSQNGIAEQFADLLQVVRSNDQAEIPKALDTLSLPNSNEWIATQFDTSYVTQEQTLYQQAFEKFRSHVWWVMGNFEKYPNFSLKVEESQIAPALSDIGFESLVPRPKQLVKIQNYRFTSTVNDPAHGTPSWVTSFIYLEGRFRMIGGTYPFWAEGLNATRGPMALPPEVIHGKTVQAAAFRSDVKGPGIEAIVHIKIEVGHDGKVKKMKVLSGDPAFVPDAKEYLQESEFPKLPDDPRFANMKAIWDMEVVFFTPQN